MIGCIYYSRGSGMGFVEAEIRIKDGEVEILDTGDADVVGITGNGCYRLPRL